MNIITFSILNALINKMYYLISEIPLVSNTHRQNEIIKSEFEVEYENSWFFHIGIANEVALGLHLLYNSLNKNLKV